LSTSARKGLGAYGVIAGATLLFQIWIRLAQCGGAAKCGLSLAKAVVWSVVWPAYWVVYLAGFTGWVSGPARFAEITTQRYDRARTGQNLTETILNPSTIGPATFGKLFARAVDDEVHAQPLYLAKVPVPGSGTRNVLYAATIANTVYAFDADDPDASAPLWRVSLGDTVPGSRPVKTDDVGQNCGRYRDFGENIGIVGTPVIDRVRRTLYVVARTKEGDQFVQRLHALDIATGAHRPNSPVVIRASVPGAGTGSVNGTLTFNPEIQNQRGSLLLSGGVV
jgi:hypothetical protein